MGVPERIRYQYEQNKMRTKIKKAEKRKEEKQKKQIRLISS